MLNRLTLCIAGIVIGLSLGVWIATPKESEADRLIRLKAELTAYEAKNTIHQWEWEDFVKIKGEIAVLESQEKARAREAYLIDVANYITRVEKEGFKFVSVDTNLFFISSPDNSNNYEMTRELINNWIKTNRLTNWTLNGDYILEGDSTNPAPSYVATNRPAISFPEKYGDNDKIFGWTVEERFDPYKQRWMVQIGVELFTEETRSKLEKLKNKTR